MVKIYINSKEKIENLYKDFIVILKAINKKGNLKTAQGYFKIITEDIISEISKDRDEALSFITRLLDVNLDEFKKIDERLYSEIFNCISQALFLNVDQLKKYFSGTNYSAILNRYMNLT